MTVSTEVTRHSWRPGAALSAEAVAFPVLNPADLVVAIDGGRTLVAGVDYVVAGDGPAGSATVRPMAAHPADAVWTATRRTARRQTAQFEAHRPFAAATLERQLDRLTLVDQEVDAARAELGARALALPPGETTAPLPSAVLRAGRLLGFDGLGKAQLLGVTALALSLLAPLQGLLPAAFKGDPGSDGSFVGSTIALPTAYIPVGTDRIRVGGHTVNGLGAADLVYDPAITAASPAVAEGWAWVTKNGRGFALSPDQLLSLPMFGARADYVSPAQRGTDNYVAFLRMKAFLSGTGRSVGSLYKYTRTINWPQGQYYTSEAFDLDFGTCCLIGEQQGVTDSDGGGGTVLVVAEDKSGIIIESANTKGTGTRPNGFGSTGSTIDGVAVVSLGGTPGVQADGFKCRGQSTLRNCIASGFPGRGFNVFADSQGSSLGNVNGSFLQNCAAFRNYLDGFLFQGGDANAITAIHLTARYNGQCGINMNQFLANTLTGYNLEGNGTVDSGPRTMPQQLGAQCRYQGNLYVVFPGRALDARTSTPGVDKSIWVFRGPVPANSIYPEYVQNMPWTEGSALRAAGLNAQNVITGGYSEPGAPPEFIGGGSMLVGGQHDAGVIGNAYLYVSSGTLTARAWQMDDGGRVVITGGMPEIGLFQQFREKGFFPWNLRSDGAGGLSFDWAGVSAVWSTRASDKRFKIDNPYLGKLAVAEFIAPVATGAVVGMMVARDGNGAERGVVPVLARA